MCDSCFWNGLFGWNVVDRFYDFEVIAVEVELNGTWRWRHDFDRRLSILGSRKGMATTLTVAEVARLLEPLKSRNPDTRNRAAKELHDYVVVTAQETTGDALAKFTKDLDRRIFELLQSSNVDEKLGGIAALDKLIDIDGGEENLTKVTRFANNLRVVLPGSEPRITVAACSALGHLVSAAGSLTTEFVEFEVKRALEWLQGDRYEARRLAAALIIRELALNAPALIYVHVPQIVDLIWVDLRDQKVSIREAAAQSLGECLALVQVREYQESSRLRKRIFDEVQRGLRMSSSDAIHGSLLALSSLLNQAPKFVDGRYTEVCEIVLRYREHRDHLLRQTIISIIPDLAKFDPEQFVGQYLASSITYLLAQIRRERERTAAFLAIGRVGVTVGSSIIEYLDQIVACVKEALSQPGKLRDESSTGPFQCISLLAVAVGGQLIKHMHGVLDIIFAGKLTEPMCQALADLSSNIPSLLPVIQEQLLDVISQTLCHRPFWPPGGPGSSQQNIHAPPAMRPQQSQSSQTQRDTAAILLALTTLGTFDFKGQMLHELVRECAWLYLEDDNTEIRKAAAVTCCQLLARDAICNQTSMHAMQLVSDVLEKLLSIAVADTEPVIRLTVLNALDERFDFHLGQAEHIRAILVCLGDNLYLFREAALRIIGRLAPHNPALILPSLRKLLMKLLTELKYSGASRQREESAMLLGRLIQAAPSLVEPYVEPIMEVLLMRAEAKDTSPAVASKVLAAIGSLAEVAGSDMTPYLDSLMAVIMDTLHDQSSPSKRQAALETLANVASNSGWVVEPYVNYPNLLNFLIMIVKTDQNAAIRRETAKVIGILGALDPYRHKIISSPSDQAAGDSSDGHMPLGVSPSSDEYYPAVTITALLKILRDPSLSVHHTAVVTAIMNIFKTLGLKCVPFLQHILPPIIGIMRTCPPNILEFYFERLSELVNTVKQHIRGYINELIQLIQEFWTLSANIQSTALALIENISSAIEGEFKTHLPTLLPIMLQIFDTDSSEKRQPTHRLLRALLVLGPIIEEYLHLVVPAVIRLIERTEQSVPLRQKAILFLGQLSRKVRLVDESMPIIHMLSHVLPLQDAALRTAALETLCTLICQLREEFILFAPLIKKVLRHHNIRHEAYETLVAALLSNAVLPNDLGIASEKLFSETPALDPQIEVSVENPLVNQFQLRQAWEVSQWTSRDDWNEWIRHLNLALLKESPAHALRACASLAGAYPALARELFNPAFISCWRGLDNQFQEELVDSLERAMASPSIPPDTLQTLLNLAEFMEQSGDELPIEDCTLSSYATKCRAYAKALRYMELDFMSVPMASTVESLISINNQLQLPDSATGILVFAQYNDDVELKESWYEKLQRWEDGLAAYERKQLEEPHSEETLLGRMRCLHNLGEWESLATLAQERWPDARADVKKAMASLAAAAAWGLGQWDTMDEYIAIIGQDSPDSAFFRAIPALHRNLYPEAQMLVERTRDLLDTELTALVGESYSRAYNIVVRIQMLAELEEIIQYKQAYEQPDVQAFIRKTWMSRIKGCQRNVEVWQRILRVRALVVPPKEDPEVWISFANLCRKSGRMNLSAKTLMGLLNEPVQGFAAIPLATNPPQVVYACLKHLWASGSREAAYAQMREFTNLLVARLGETPSTDAVTSVEAEHDPNGHAPLLSRLARCFLKLGDWQIALREGLSESIIPDILRSYLAATQCDRDWYKAWHAWAYANFEVLSFFEGTQEIVPEHLVATHAVAAVQGIFRSITLSKSSSLQDTLRLLTVWFKYGYQQDVNVAISEGFATVTIETWLQVIPQLIARITAPSESIQRLVHWLLFKISKRHPQALLYSLTVATKSPDAERRTVAQNILLRMRTHDAQLVDQALLVSQELIRVAILWHEMWHEGLVDASRQYFSNNNIERMFSILEPLHQMLEQASVSAAKRLDLLLCFPIVEAADWCATYRQTLDRADLDQAWLLYRQIFEDITRALDQIKTIDMQSVSPRLLEAKDLGLAVPGSHKSGEQVVRIASFLPKMSVLSSKQRPRRICIRGSDGKEHPFLLKGSFLFPTAHMLDERVMQLLGLVNTLLATDPEAAERHLSITRYSVVPLSPNSGLIGWMSNTDTLHKIISDYRDSRKIVPNMEQILLLRMAPDYNHLPLLQKVDVFTHVLEQTRGEDLQKVLWITSKNSEVWLDRRTNYTRSLAVMSMVGYLVGLGDRHFGNIMLDYSTGKIAHIDFGDCFEVAMRRSTYPEKVPFRLTRMLVNAMEARRRPRLTCLVSGIEGTFRATCEHTMRVLRENSQSLMAVLEAFVYDPLISQHLMADPDSAESATMASATTESTDVPPEELNQRALEVVNRISSKLAGRDFEPAVALSVPRQVQRLIEEAKSLENLCQAFMGWAPFW
ncbi:phosphatidylinositol kinase-related protein kinase tor1 [Polyrhizophydium stewartii]|uniref:Serine/threonine-protein kinase TOR n=1 Tax=Polyrhizophydium stewartii TaxID=2732419 RepID=A0ABR4N9K2_9FUNG